MPRNASFVARWSPRIGRKAARLYVLTGPTTTIGVWSAPVWLILYLVGERWSRLCAYVVAGIGFACLALASLSLHLMYKALTERFGFKVSWRNAPPYRYKAFGAWCRKHGIDPNAGKPLSDAAERDRPGARDRAARRDHPEENSRPERNSRPARPGQRGPAHRQRSKARG